MKKYLPIIFLLLIIALYRISTLPIHIDEPRLSNHQNGYYDYEGVIHWHTEYSKDSMGSYNSLSALGNHFHLDFLITTEHNNLLALYDHQEGWHGRMLTLVGIESTRQEGYLLGLNFHLYTTRDEPTDKFLSQVDGQGGFAIIAHPKNPRPRWHWKGPIDPRIVGQEIVDLTDQFAAASPMDIMAGFLYYPLNRPAAYIQMYQRPTEALKMWDEITSRRPFIGIYAPDVHQSIRLFGKNLLRFPKSNDIIPIAHNHVVLPAPFTGNFVQDKKTLCDAIKKGQLYVAIDSLEDATGFFFLAKQGDKTVWMGDQLPAGVKTDFNVKLPQPLYLKNSVINVFHNGQKIASSQEKVFTFQAMLPGSYRVEVEVNIPTFWGFKRNVVWIYSNPIYLR